jgi:L-asparaginase II
MIDGSCQITALRGQTVENSHLAHVARVSAKGELINRWTEAPERLFFLRSTAKPFQALPLWHHPQAQALLDSAAWATVCASHGGSTESLTQVQSLLAQAGASEADLQCGSHRPFYEPASDALILAHQHPDKRHHNCSGKHAGMLLACRLSGWDQATYLEHHHPLQQAITQAIQDLSQTQTMAIGIDGCGAPNHALPLDRAAFLFSQLVTHPDLIGLSSAMRSHPDLVGDPNRLDTALMKASGGRILAKVGADGVMGLAHTERGEGAFLKIEDGSGLLRDKLALALVQAWGWLSPEEAAPLLEKAAWSCLMQNSQGKVVGEWVIHTPTANSLQ